MPDPVVTRAPDAKGSRGRAWRVVIPAPENLARPEHAACVDQWVFHAPATTPLWPWHVVSCVHLRDLAGAEPATKTFPEAGHEISCWALDPEHHVDGEFDPGTLDGGTARLRMLVPADAVVQFAGLDDHGARRLCETVVARIVAGSLVPHEAFQLQWIATVDAVVRGILATN